MSLNIAAEGFSFSTTAVTDITAVAAATFDGGNADVESADLQLQVDTSAAGAPVDLAGLPAPVALGVCPGATLTLVKTNVGGQNLVYTDPVTGITYSYVNKQGESITLEADLVNDQWVVRP